MRDKNGQPVSVGERVTIEGTVTSIAPYPNDTATVEVAAPNGTPLLIGVSGFQVCKAHPEAPTTEFPRLMWTPDGQEITVHSASEFDARKGDGFAHLPPGFIAPPEQAPTPAPEPVPDQADPGDYAPPHGDEVPSTNEPPAPVTTEPEPLL